ncbi:hypothetical protein ABZT34_11320 [Streptomyces sp. NPDC005329]|uniref:hypothetical protein n=1 Tax=Streptomyces sp. NPDC005329 TaxID=3157034 RepID=UPI0033BE1605
MALEDDSASAIRSWIDDRTGELPAGFADDVRAWLLVLLDGDSRADPRSHTCLYVYLGGVRPLLENGATTRDHLREITVADVTAALSPLRGWQRRNAIAAPRSVFRFAKKRGLIFANPTTRLKAEDIPRSLLPMTDAEVLAVQRVTVTPAQRLIVALAAVHTAYAGLDVLHTILAGEAPRTTVHGGVEPRVVVVTAVRARARAGSAWQACREPAPFVATQQRRRTTHG